MLCYVDRLQKELEGQEEKKDRADKMVNKLTKEIRAARKCKTELPEEEDIKVRELKEFNAMITKQFGVVCHQNPDFAPIINMYFTQAGLQAPPTPAPGSSRPPSTAGTSRSQSSYRSVFNSQKPVKIR